MGRYTTVQAYSDNNPKLVHVSYDQAKAKDEAGGGAAGGKLIVEKTDQVMGSCAGAGSGEFHTYRAHRRREMHRVAAMEETAQKEEAAAKLRSTMEQSQKECEERTRKRAEKRKKKKQNQKVAAASARKVDEKVPDKRRKVSTEQAGSASSISFSKDEKRSNDKEEFIYIPVADQAAAGGDGGAPSAFKNDGSFLEKMIELESKQEQRGVLQGGISAVQVK